MRVRTLKTLVFILLIGAAASGYVAYRAYETAQTPYKGFGDEIFFTVERGAAGASIARALDEAGIVEDERIFKAALRLRGDTTRIQAGEYRFSEPLSTVEVLDRLVAGDIYTFGVTVPEGLTLVEIAEHLASHDVGNAEELEDAFQNGALIAKLDQDAPNLEGYLFPTRYHFTRNPTAAEVALAMVGQFKAVFDDGKRSKAKELGLTVREVVALASIIEKETGSADERPLIGSVVWNRLERGMTLGMDSTIIYALKLQGTYDGNIRRVDLELASPYNTYRVAGIPPGPIASPGEAAIDAVLEPADSSYLYFVSKNDGTHHFSRSFREHSNAVRKYQVEYFRQRRRQKNGEGSS